MSDLATLRKAMVDAATQHTEAQAAFRAAMETSQRPAVKNLLAKAIDALNTITTQTPNLEPVEIAFGHLYEASVDASTLNGPAAARLASMMVSLEEFGTALADVCNVLDSYKVDGPTLLGELTKMHAEME